MDTKIGQQNREREKKVSKTAWIKLSSEHTANDDNSLLAPYSVH